MESVSGTRISPDQLQTWHDEAVLADGARDLREEVKTQATRVIALIGVLDEPQGVAAKAAVDNGDENLRGEIARVLERYRRYLPDLHEQGFDLLNDIHVLVRDEQSKLLRSTGEKMAGDVRLGGTAAMFYLNRCANELDERPI